LIPIFEGTGNIICNIRLFPSWLPWLKQDQLEMCGEALEPEFSVILEASLKNYYSIHKKVPFKQYLTLML
jgi:hypothetical protein